MSKPDLLTVAEVAKRLKQHPNSVRRSIREGRIPARKISGRLYVNEEAISVPSSVEATEADAPEQAPAGSGQ